MVNPIWFRFNREKVEKWRGSRERKNGINSCQQKIFLIFSPFVKINCYIYMAIYPLNPPTDDYEIYFLATFGPFPS